MTDRNILYHYTTVEKAYSILCSKQLLLNTFANVNDPWENKLRLFGIKYAQPNSEKRDLIQLSKKCTEILFADCKMLCFSVDTSHETKTNKALVRQGYSYGNMWAHYGGRHAGVCLAIDLDIFKEENKDLLKSCHLGNIKYLPSFDGNVLHLTHEKINYDEPREYLKGEFRNENIESLYFTKLIDWQAENEVRIVHFSDRVVEEYCTIQKSLVRLFTGIRFDKHNMAVLKQLAGDTRIHQLDCIHGNIALYSFYTAD